MPKPKKTRKQKIAITEKKLEKISYSYTGSSTPVSVSVKKEVVPQETLTTFLRYDASLIYKDLFKTCVISFILIASLVGIAVYTS